MERNAIGKEAPQPTAPPSGKRSAASDRGAVMIALVAIVGIGVHLVLRFGFKMAGEFHGISLHELPLIAVLVVGGIPLVAELLIKLVRLEFGSALLAGISIVTAACLGE